MIWRPFFFLVQATQNQTVWKLVFFVHDDEFLRHAVMTRNTDKIDTEYTSPPEEKGPRRATGYSVRVIVPFP